MNLKILIPIFVMTLILPFVYSDSLPSFNTTIYDFNITILDILTGQVQLIDVSAGNNPDVLFGAISNFTNPALRAYNISNSSAITIISSFDLDATIFFRPRRAEVGTGDIVYLTFPENASLLIMNVSNPASMTILGNLTKTDPTITLQGARNIKEVGDLVYLIAGNDNAFNIINVSDKRNPVLIGNVTGAGSPNFLNFPWELEVVGDIAFVVSGSDVGLTVINISDGRNPFVINHTPVGQAGFGEFFTNGLDAIDDLVAVSTCDFDGSETTTLLDVSDPRNPVILSFINALNGGPNFLACTNDVKFSEVEGFTDILFNLGTLDNAVTLINFSNTSNIRTVGAIVGSAKNDGSPNFLDFVNRIEIIDDIFYTAGNGDDALGAFRWIQDFVAPLPPPTPHPPISAELAGLPLRGVADISAMAVIIFLTIGLFIGLIGSSHKKGK